MTTRLKSRFLLPLILLLFVAWTSLAQERQCEWTNGARIVAIGDVHGDCNQLIGCLRASKVIDASNKWIGGKTHLVQMGDIFDRGPESKQAMDLLMALGPQARESGGEVHVLIGNHEAMILAGDYGYLYKTEAEPYGGTEGLKKAVSPEGKYGKWIRCRNAVIRIDDILFVHGGISPKYAHMPLKEMNKAIAESLGSGSGAAADEDGPLWYRGLAQEEDEGRLKEALDPVMKQSGVKHIVVGHTITQSLKINVKAGGALIMVDVGMSQTYRRGPAMCLVVDGGRFYAVTESAKEELSSTNGR